MESLNEGSKLDLDGSRTGKPTRRNVTVKEGPTVDQQEKVSHLEGRMTSAESTIADVKAIVTRHEKDLSDLRVGLATLHGDLKMNNESTRRIDDNVSKVVQDTAEMLAVYKATPRMQEDTKWWVWVVGTIATIIVTGSTFYMAFLKEVAK